MTFEEKWIEALESGKYKQCRAKFFDGEGYCCLGVAIDVAKPDFIDKVEGRHLVFKDGARLNNQAPVEVKNIVRSPLIEYFTPEDLAAWNDAGGSFSRIANKLRLTLDSERYKAYLEDTWNDV